jgi:NAD-dependent dihydropyrimidine dehydrogenase PreA subunit
MLYVNRSLCDKDSIKFSSFPLFSGGEYQDFVDGIYKDSRLTNVCPTDALQLSECTIDPKSCVDCLLCHFASKNGLIEFIEDQDSLDRFLDYCIADKKFATKWIAILLQSSSRNSMCGIEIKFPEGSRSKRIPLVYKDTSGISIWKVASTVRDIEKTSLALTDIRDSIASSKQLPNPTCIVVVSQKPSQYIDDESICSFLDNHTNTNSYFVISLERIWRICRDEIKRNIKFIDWQNRFQKSNGRVQL